jgi:hypothetical protein
MGLSCCRRPAKPRRQHPAVAIRQAPEARRIAGQQVIPETDVENGVERPTADIRCQERPPADAPRFATTGRSAHWRAAIVPGIAGFAPGPDPAAIHAATDRWFPRQTAAAIFQRRLWATAPPALPPATATPAKPSKCAAAKRPPIQWKMFCHNRRAGRDWNKTRAGHGLSGRWRGPDHCREKCCAGSAFRLGRSGDSAAV